MGKMVTLIYPKWKLTPSTKFYASTATSSTRHTHQTRCQRSWIHGDRSWLSSIRTHRRNPESTGFACSLTNADTESFLIVLDNIPRAYLSCTWISIVVHGCITISSYNRLFRAFADTVIWFSVLKARKYSLTELLRNVSSDTGLNDYLAHKFACTLIRSQ